jgi:opacity protein-like surface antigen
MDEHDSPDDARRRTSGTILLALLLLVAAIRGVDAQTPESAGAVVSIGSGWSGLWDDETNLGRGVPFAAGVSTVLAGKLRAAADVDWTSHVRDSGYLRAEGTLLSVFARATYLAGTPQSRARPLIGAGLGVVRSVGDLITSSLVVGSQGLPVRGPTFRQPWSLTRPAFELHGGMAFRVNDRLALRPEGRWRATFGSAASPSIEPPLIGIQTVVHLDIAF